MSPLGSASSPSRPHTPIPKLKYIDDLALYGRDYAHRRDPFEGDFCVMSVDHVASVAHLGTEAMETAKRIPPGHYVAYVAMSIGLPYEGHPPIHARWRQFVKAYLDSHHSTTIRQHTFPFFRIQSDTAGAIRFRLPHLFPSQTAAPPHSQRRVAESPPPNATIAMVLLFDRRSTLAALIRHSSTSGMI
ncbi:hypothetical protein PENSPDRAFT_372842 [Peniophora sp. CONT]|nr:hypothetical protein PENSPDRAFT_372842 [Peniophora sp. CONT]